MLSRWKLNWAELWANESNHEQVAVMAQECWAGRVAVSEADAVDDFWQAYTTKFGYFDNFLLYSKAV
ncbi:hypothetical protein BJP36_08610 [Moorena producens JHB]|uniref:Uncharacterized protein n=1 Tax=Moorena producens (strain JHB) TaxID=1454205 RepID=A0A1D9FX79_MOOP1|nr:hypothetical protein [Moorena producens]AOY79976.1 hypothetical protein BJP36_08610 [Moorena producens JHB]